MERASTGKAGEPRPEQRFHTNAEILRAGTLAPLPLAPNSRQVLQGVFRLALESCGAPADLLQPAASVGGGLVHASQELVLASNRLLESPREHLAEEVRRLMWACRDFLGSRDSAYVLRQATEGSPLAPAEAGSAPQPGRERLKGLSERLERRLEDLELPRGMDPVRFAVLQVELDAAYDIAARILERFYEALAGPPGRFRAFARDLPEVVVRELIPDHILGGGSEGGSTTDLVGLLPELEREFL